MNIKISFSDYGLNEGIEDLLKSQVNNYEIEPRMQMHRVALDLNGTGAELHFFECGHTYHQNTCPNLRNGYLYHCPILAYNDIL